MQPLRVYSSYPHLTDDCTHQDGGSGQRALGRGKELKLLRTAQRRREHKGFSICYHSCFAGTPDVSKAIHNTCMKSGEHGQAGLCAGSR